MHSAFDGILLLYATFVAIVIDVVFESFQMLHDLMCWLGYDTCSIQISDFTNLKSWISTVLSLLFMVIITLLVFNHVEKTEERLGRIERLQRVDIRLIEQLMGRMNDFDQRRDIIQDP